MKTQMKAIRVKEDVWVAVGEYARRNEITRNKAVKELFRLAGLDFEKYVKEGKENAKSL